MASSGHVAALHRSCATRRPAVAQTGTMRRAERAAGLRGSGSRQGCAPTLLGGLACHGISIAVDSQWGTLQLRTSRSNRGHTAPPAALDARMR